MSGSFANDSIISSSSWAAFERMVLRILHLREFSNSAVVGMSGDGGADLVGNRNGKRWLFQAKALSSPVQISVVTETLAAREKYDAEIPVIVSKSGFTREVYNHQKNLVSEGIQLQLWDRSVISSMLEKIPIEAPVVRKSSSFEFRQYQTEAIERIVGANLEKPNGSALIVLATGLGKTWVAGEAIRRMKRTGDKVLVLAHTIDLVLQLEKAFWPFMDKETSTCVLTGSDRPKSLDYLDRFDYVFATRDAVDSALTSGANLPNFRFVVVDECHHLGAEVYDRVLENVNFGAVDGPFLLGMTATPWRPDGTDLTQYFDEPVINVDLTRGLRDGYLANVDYRMYTDNVDWTALERQSGGELSAKRINRTMFITEWDEAVIDRIREAWAEIGETARGIVFCGTIEHAIRIANTVNALGFTRAEAMHSGGISHAKGRMNPVERNKVLWDFADGRVGLICAVDILNEGVDVPDVNLVVFQRVTHSRRVFTQQLGRGLRLAPNKTKVIVLDFVTDVRRFAAGLQLERDLTSGNRGKKTTKKVSIGSKVTFRKANSEDKTGHDFLREWLKDLDEVEAAGEDKSILSFPKLAD